MNFINLGIFIIISLVFVNRVSADEKIIDSQLVAVSANIKLAEKDKHLVSLFSHRKSPLVKLTFMFKSKNIVQIDSNSITLSQGKEWKCNLSPRFSDNADVATFTIAKKGEFIDKIKDIKLEGTINIITATNIVHKSFSLLTFDKPLEIDGFKFTLLKDKLKIVGDHRLIKEVTVTQSKKELWSNGYSSNSAEKTYTFKGIDKGAEINFIYWDGLVTKKVKFSKK